MFVAALILIISTGLFGFYLQTVCQKILRRQFSQEFFQSIVNANRLEFLSVRKAVENLNSPVEYPRLTLTLKCDFLALTYLLKNAANINQRYTYEERLLIVYFKLIFASLITRHWLKLGESSAVLKLTKILEYFANVVGERVNTVRFGNLTASDYLLNL
jgi:hypothetical protein